MTLFRDRKGSEVDLIVDLGRDLLAVETKSGHPVANDFFDGLRTFETIVAAARPRRRSHGFVVYGGNDSQRRSAGRVVSWSEIESDHRWSVP